MSVHPPLSLEAVRQALAATDAGPLGAQITYYPQIDSTMDAAREQAAAGAPHGSLIIADEQLAGRGRLGRSWSAPFGANLLFSLILRPQLRPAYLYRVVMAAGLAAAEACEAAAGVQVGVKWPNDLQIGGRKCAGLLPEGAVEGDSIQWCIIGLGLNVNQAFEASDPLAQTAASLYSERGRMFDRAALLGDLLGRLNRKLALLGSDLLLEDWQARCISLGQQVRVHSGEEHVEGRAEAIDEDGALLLRLPDGRIRRITAGEATLRPS